MQSNRVPPTHGTGAAFAWGNASEEFALFRTLSAEQRLVAFGAMTRQDLVRGQLLVEQGGPSDALFLVLHGALAVYRTDHPEPIAELRAGELVGEIGFFANIPRTANVIAIRDSSVLVLTRAAYAKLAQETPGIVEALLAALAQRFAIQTARLLPARASPKARTVALIAGGHEPAPADFEHRLRQRLAAVDAEIVDLARVQALFPGLALDAPEVADWLNRIEYDAPLVAYFGGQDASEWARKAIRQADLVVFVCRGDALAPDLTEIESFACGVHPASARRLVRVHDRRRHEVSGTAAWLARLPSFMHHHVSLEDQIDIDSLVRFLCGRAVGFVAGGGGSLGTAHVGIYKAFRERGVMFDIFVGTSVGSAMVAGFAKNYDAERLERGTHEIFVSSRSFRRPTWPRYALLDHKAFDKALADQYGHNCRIEDCWRPFAAVATNLSTHSLELIRTGLLWQAVRASSAIPGLLPPFYTRDGLMLVDGCLVDNVPLAQMHQLKSGPNLVVHFGEPATEMFDVDYAALPGRLELLAAMLTPFRRKSLPAAPSAVNVLWRSLVAHQRYDTLPITPLDMVMRPPTPDGIDVTDFDRHQEIFESSYRWARETIAAQEAAHHPAIAAFVASARGADQAAPVTAPAAQRALFG
ncbi:patatin-like phospholipase domain-containing protein [Bradyrhizobium sp. ISRA443]|uniref:patatin-like phospholipase family protein n=1 Tax=unclassified Bradyrhizobium TaxID=2631580 RepID=UPI00247A84A0|nr:MULTISPECIES: cyclic nucleotide-binding and patatin-like phospholipase domain-containing protein [unclassified Bradyrhizobium]WGS01829.1 patatin-like phospholipase domain-containing protein [Bradyrhizobium sp. ISRA436]WGS08715.1 patatin-like phospholipase domain-containing protein [Bradyrhizobium sp. ISRA437]WGS15603.1 patatin-like phospholipase domain-containing protein [Bradyrhizobium sp. ISRA443]